VRRHLVFVIPGIGGSILANGADPTDRNEVWNAQLPNLLQTALSPASLELDRDLVPIGLIPDIGVIPGWSIIHGYGTLRRRLAKGTRLDTGDPALRDLDADVVLFPYDFRRGIVAAAERLHSEVEARLETLGATDDDARVVLIGHSMGGLVARYYCGPLGGWRRTRTILTLGSPHRGAPKAVAFATSGISVGQFRADAFNRVVATWPGLYDLFPTYAGVLDTRTQARVRLSDLELAERATIARAQSMHDEITAAWRDIPREGTEVRVRLGWSHHTPSEMTYDGDRLGVTRADDYFASSGAWADLEGDGVVPAISAVPLEMSSAAPAPFLTKYRHGPIAKDDSILDLLNDLEGYPSVAHVRQPPTELPTLGIDVPEVASDFVNVRAKVRGPSRDGIRMWFRVAPRSGDVPPLKGELPASEEGFAATIPLLECEGAYDVRVTATDPSGLSISAEDSVFLVRA
jgi:pimeloyl-ACP methyl ester carboxylesterase